MESDIAYGRFDSTTALTEDDIPLKPENRRRTDKHFLTVFLVAIAILVGFLIYSINSAKTNENQGFTSEFNNPVSDYTDLLGTLTTKPSFDIDRVVWRLIVASGVSIGLCLILTVLYRYQTTILVWAILILTWISWTFASIVLWICCPVILLNIVSTIITLALLFILVFMKDKIRLVVMLFKEATKAVFDMKSIFVIPILTIVTLFVVLSGFATTTYLMLPSNDSNDVEDIIEATVIINSIIGFWISQFFIGIQYMIIGGAVAKWYFVRNKDTLRDPVFNSCIVTVKYHLGTVALGSLIITIVATLRALLNSLAKNYRLRYLINCFMGYIERFLKWFTKNSYIVTAMHGTPFIESGKHAVKLLTLNICNTISLTSIGDFVIVMSEVLIVFLSILTSHFLFLDISDDLKSNVVYCHLFVAAVALICCYTILGTFENAYSTIFLCVCQDFLINNGIAKPYAMTRNMMEFLEESKRVFAKKIEKKNLPTI